MNQHNDYTLLFAQRQEQLIVEYIRRSVDLDVRLQIVTKTKDELESELNNLKNLFEQATTSIQALTIENVNYKRKLEKIEPDYQNELAEKNKYIRDFNSIKSKFEELQKEYDRQNIELNNVFSGKKQISKRKAVDAGPNETVSTGDENIF